ncbi:MAG: Yip1 family protein [Phenylobacterium sp.]
MNVVEPGSAGASLFARVGAILMRPDETWDLIDAETTQVPDLYKTYVAPLAAIPAVCGAVSLLGLGGIHLFGVHLRPSLTGVITEMVVSYVLTLVGVYVLALVIDELAPQFGAARGRTQAFKLAAYSGTAWWVAGIFRLLPGVGGLFMLLGGLYTLYLMYLGLPKLMKVEGDRTMPYLVVSLLVTLLLTILISLLSSCFTNFGGPLSIDT